MTTTYTTATNNMPKVGDRVRTMCHGHMVTAIVIAVNDKHQATGKPEITGSLVFEEPGRKTLCVDFGQNWYVEQGHTWRFGLESMRAAAQYTDMGFQPV
jgi:hypothetical protein